MAIKEHIGYPDHILQEGNPKLDQEYAHVSTGSKVAFGHGENDRSSLAFNLCFWSPLTPKLNFSEDLYFENILENLKSEAHKSLKKLREAVDPDL